MTASALGSQAPVQAERGLLPQEVSLLAPHILIIDPDSQRSGGLAQFLARYGMAVSVARDAEQGREYLLRQAPELVVLEAQLPGEDGLSLCRYVYEHWRTPVILVSPHDGAADRIVGLELGADDYMARPFDPRELVARIRTVLRRLRQRPHAEGRVQTEGTLSRQFYFDQWQLDTVRRQLRKLDGAAVELGAAEYRLLLAFVEHPNRVLSRERLQDMTAREDSAGYDRSVDTQVSRLRKKLEDDARRPRLLRTAWGDGYMLVAEVRCQLG